jgi:hypothetical protein
MIWRSIPDIPAVFLVEDFFGYRTRNFVTQSLNRCARLRESDRTLRDGSFGWRCPQALRARLRSHRPSGTKAIRPSKGLALSWAFGVETPALNHVAPFGGACSGDDRSPEGKAGRLTY